MLAVVGISLASTGLLLYVLSLSQIILVIALLWFLRLGLPT